MKRRGIVAKVEETIRRKALLQAGDRFLIGVSGGADSIALAQILIDLSADWRWTVGICHVNHQLRGEESEEDARYVERFAAERGVPCWVERVDVEAHRAAGTPNLQAAARELRHAAFRRAALRFGTETVALAHHADDQAETVLMRLLRGTGVDGLGGIRMRSEVDGLTLIRPLLGIPKAELEAFCAERGLNPREDSSNRSRHYFRNVVRHDILPYLRRFSPQVDDALRRLAVTAAEESDCLDQIARSLIREGFRADGDGWETDRGFFLRAHIALQRRMIKIILNCLGEADALGDFGTIERIREAIAAEAPTTLELHIGEFARFRRAYERIQWLRSSAGEGSGTPYRVEIDVSKPGVLPIPGTRFLLEWDLEPVQATQRPYIPLKDEFAACFDADDLASVLVVRSRRPGDRMEPHGLNGTKKVKEMFIDRKVPAWRRDSWPIVETRDAEIVWIPGIGRSVRALVTGNTRTVLRMICREKPAGQ